MDWIYRGRAGCAKSGCLLDIPVEILSRQKDCKCGVQCGTETRGINLRVSDI